jgi:Flp pilus assembly protein TadD
MMIRNRLPILCLSLASAVLAVPVIGAAQTPVKPQAPETGSPAATPATPDATPNRAQAYYHAALADLYEEQAVNTGRPEFVQHAVDEYKYALNADPGWAEWHGGLADLYFRTGRAHEAEATARELLKTHPDDISAHKLLGRIYLRQLGEQQNSVSSASPSGNTLDQAIAEFEKIVTLLPKSVEDHMVLGQLYTVKHQSTKAEAQFKMAQDIEPESEEVVVNLARVHAESSDLDHAANY